MTLALNLFFWDDWLGVGAPPPPPAPTAAPADEESKTTKGKKQRGPKKYTAADPFFWDTREAYLQSLVKQSISQEAPKPVTTEEPPATKSAPVRMSIEEEIPQLVTNRAAVISSIRLAETTAQLHERGKRLASLNRSIALLQQRDASKSAAEQAATEEAEFEARSKARQQRLDQLRGAVRVQLRKLASSRKS